MSHAPCTGTLSFAVCRPTNAFLPPPRVPAAGSTTIQECPEAATLLVSEDEACSTSALSNNFRWSNGVKELVYACPDALHEPDPVSKLLPFMMASLMATTTGMERRKYRLLSTAEAPLLRFL
jgi:hypothetical protein